uniref:Uncharacterized protein n=1 Tax=Arundo donax TaxID=35708 RepID=A0A0A8Y8R1_ARUDO
MWFKTLKHLFCCVCKMPRICAIVGILPGQEQIF